MFYVTNNRNNQRERKSMEQINPATWISSIKTYVLDTNVLLHDPNCIGAFKDNEIFISIIAIVGAFSGSENSIIAMTSITPHPV